MLPRLDCEFLRQLQLCLRVQSDRARVTFRRNSQTQSSRDLESLIRTAESNEITNHEDFRVRFFAGP